LFGFTFLKNLPPGGLAIFGPWDFGGHPQLTIPQAGMMGTKIADSVESQEPACEHCLRRSQLVSHSFSLTWLHVFEETDQRAKAGEFHDYPERQEWLVLIFFPKVLDKRLLAASGFFIHGVEHVLMLIFMAWF
jgi:hypothetical protein